MTVLVIEHTDTCTAAMVGRWLADAGLDLHRVRGHRGEDLPTGLSGHHGLLVMGGPMGARDDLAHPWLAGTKALLRESVAAEVPTLGICLGHQLLAVACGGEIDTIASGKQLGLQPVTRTAAGRVDPLVATLPDDAQVVHWNGDIVTTLPPNAQVLATTPAGIQAIRIGTAAWGVQFHPEVGAAEVGVWATRDVAEGTLDAAVVQPLMAAVERAEPSLVATLRPMIDRFAAAVRP